MNLMDTFNKWVRASGLRPRIMKEMKESNEGNQTISALLSSLSIQDNGSSKPKQPAAEEADYIYRRNEGMD